MLTRTADVAGTLAQVYVLSAAGSAGGRRPWQYGLAPATLGGACTSTQGNVSKAEQICAGGHLCHRTGVLIRIVAHGTSPYEVGS
jgi:hypothetical protein